MEITGTMIYLSASLCSQLGPIPDALRDAPHFARTFLLYLAEEVRAQVAQVLESIHTELWLPAELQQLDSRQGAGAGSANGSLVSVVADLAGGVVRFNPKAVKPTDIILLTDCKVGAHEWGA